MANALKLIDDPGITRLVSRWQQSGSIPDDDVWRDVAHAQLSRYGVARIRLLNNPEQYPLPDIKALWRGLSEQLGALVPQTYRGNRLSLIRDQGANYRNPETRGHQTNAALGFHSDRCDVAALLYMRVASSGGELSVVSHEEAVQHVGDVDPDALETLMSPLPFDLRPERIFPAPEWTLRPVFWRTEKGVRGHYIRRFIEDSQRHHDCPRLTPEQVRALDVLDGVLADLAPERSFPPTPGEAVLTDNYRVMHSRRAFVDTTHDAARLVLRTWIAPFDSERLPDALLSISGSIEPGTFRGGVGASSAYHARLGRRLT